MTQEENKQLENNVSFDKNSDGQIHEDHGSDRGSVRSNLFGGSQKIVAGSWNKKEVKSK